MRMTIIELLNEKAPDKYRHLWGEKEGEVSLAKISKDCGISRGTLYNASKNGKISSKTVDLIVAKLLNDEGESVLTKADFLPYI